FYMKITGKGHHYYEEHLTYWGLKKLTRAFICHDYTKKMVNDPDGYAISYMLNPDSMAARMARLLAKNLYWAFPNYVWLLQKPKT
ncbi:MAG: hypothetical protein ACXVBU_18830, partial [Ktedonobacteraceae bacterium]